MRTHSAELPVDVGIDSLRPEIGVRVAVGNDADAQIIGFAIEGARYRIDTIEG